MYKFKTAGMIYSTSTTPRLCAVSQKQFPLYDMRINSIQPEFFLIFKLDHDVVSLSRGYVLRTSSGI